MATQNLLSVGFLAQEHQRSPVEIVKTLSEAGVMPAQTLNLVAYYDLVEANRVLAPGQLIRGTADAN